MTPEELSLRDIQLPDPVSWWPPAIGWWLIAAALVAAVAGAVAWRRSRARRARAPATLARRELHRLEIAWGKHRDPQRLLRELSTWLRRASMSLAGRETTAGLTGDRWMALLAELAGKDIFANERRLLVEMPYRGDAAVAPEEGDRLLSLCGDWLAAAARITEGGQ